MRRTRRKSRVFKKIMMLVALIGVVIIGRQEYNIYLVKQEQKATQQRIEALQKEKAALESERKRLDDPHYIEKLAREHYNMVGENEIPLFIVDGKN